jgi:hypothetical protein
MANFINKISGDTIEAVLVKGGYYNGSTFDGFPFSEALAWVTEAMANGDLTPFKPEQSDVALWQVVTASGTVWAQPGNWIVYQNGQLSVVQFGVIQVEYQPVM